MSSCIRNRKAGSRLWATWRWTKSCKSAAPHQEEQRLFSSEMMMDDDRSKGPSKPLTFICHCLRVSPWQHSLAQGCHRLGEKSLARIVSLWRRLIHHWPQFTHRPSAYHTLPTTVLFWRTHLVSQEQLPSQMHHSVLSLTIQLMAACASYFSNFPVQFSANWLTSF